MQAGTAPVVDVGPVERSLLDPQSLQEAKVTARVRFATVALDVRAIVEAQRAVGDPSALTKRVVDLALQALYAAIGAVARQKSCSLFDVIGPALRRDVEAELTSRVARALAPMGLGVGPIDELSLTMDPSTEAWLRAKRASARMAPAKRASPSSPPDEATAVAGSCSRCGAQVAAEEKTCPSCGGLVRPPPPCVACGSEIRPGSRFCVNCGARAFGVPT